MACRSRVRELRAGKIKQGGSRLTSLPVEQKELLQTLAVIGRESPLGLIKRVASTTDAQLERMLADLQTLEFIYEQPALTEAEYIFKHALTQEVAYNSLLVNAARFCTNGPDKPWNRCSPSSWTII
jgi:predicted ATPase